MKFTYAPDGQDPQDFEFDAGQLTTDEAELIEGAGGAQWRTFGQWVQMLDEAGWRAWRVILWVMLRRSNPDLDLNEVKPKVNEIQIDTSEPEGKDQPGEEATATEDSPTGSESQNAATEA